MKIKYEKAKKTKLEYLNGGDCFFLPNEPGNIYMKRGGGNPGHSTKVLCMNIATGSTIELQNGGTKVIEVLSEIVIDMKNVWEKSND